MNSAFSQKIESILHMERLDAYRQDGADHTLTLSSGHIEVMRSGKTLALDVMSEYVVFLKSETEEGKVAAQ